MEKAEISKGLSDRCLAGSSALDLNDAGTGEKSDTRLTQPRSRAVRGHVYFIQAGDKVKIGFSTRPLDRLKALQTSHPDQLKIIGTMLGLRRLEGHLHDMFRRWHVRGEWFQVCPAITRYIEQNTPEGSVRAKKRNDARMIGPAPVHSPADKETIKKLNALRTKHGADNPVGQRCSNLIAQIGNMRFAEGESREMLTGLMRGQAGQLMQILAVPL